LQGCNHGLFIWLIRYLGQEEKAMIVYVTTQGSRIVREGGHLLVKKDNDTYHTLFVHKLEQLVLCGNISITPPAMRLLLKENIDTVFLQKDGRYLGRLSGGEGTNIFVRKLQFLLLTDDEFCLKAAQSIIKGKMANMATVMNRIKRTKQAKGAGRAAKAIKDMISRLEMASDTESLRGMEGRASALYFQNFGLGLKGDWRFHRRVRRPPTDPVNAVLSLLYTFLINRMYAAVRLAGLDPYPGVMHSLEYGRMSLILDLVEEFRSIIADTLTLSLFNLGILKKEDFVTINRFQTYSDRPENQAKIEEACHDPIGRMHFQRADGVFDLKGAQLEPESFNHDEMPEPKLPVQLKPDAFKRVISAFEQKLTTEFTHPLAEKPMTYSQAMVYQARLFRRLVEGEAAVYQPLLLR
jgi:CRISPR-associated protein Cas1